MNNELESRNANVDGARFSARGYRPGDEEAIRALFRDVVGHEQSADEWVWRNCQVPTGPAWIILVEDGARLAGHTASIRRWMWVEGTAVVSGTGHDLMVAAEYRGSGASDALFAHARSTVPPFCFSMGFPSDPGTRASRRRGGLLLGQLPQWVRPLGPGASAWSHRAGRRALTIASRGLARAGRRPSLEATPLEDLGPEVDDLASESRTWWPCGVVRYAAHLRWRFQAQPGRAWKIRAVRDPRGRLKGLAVHGTKDGVGWLADLVAPDTATARTLLLDAVEELRRDGCELVVCWYLDPRPWAIWAFRASGFVRYRSGPSVMLVPRTSCPRVTARLGSWFLTAGDTDLV
jgi:hypothetical protein